MTVHNSYKIAMDRQLGEAICIARAGGMDSRSVMNLKEEYTRCIIPESQNQGLGNRGRTEAKRTIDQESPEKVAKKRQTEKIPPKYHKIKHHPLVIYFNILSHRSSLNLHKNLNLKSGKKTIFGYVNKIIKYQIIFALELRTQDKGYVG